MAHHYNREKLYKLPHIRESTYMKGLREGKRIRILENFIRLGSSVGRAKD